MQAFHHLHHRRALRLAGSLCGALIGLAVLTAQAANTPPTISAINDVTIDEDTSTGPLAFTISDAETPAADLTLSRASTDTAVVPLTGIVLGGAGANRTVTVTPAPNAFGSSLITITVSDGTNSASRQFQVTVRAVNDPPTLTVPGKVTVDEDNPIGPLTITVNDVDDAPASLTLTAASSNQALLPNANLVLGGSGTARTLSATLTPNANGTTRITVTVSDGEASVSDDFDIEVRPVNDPPHIGGSVTTVLTDDQPGTPLDGLTVTDPDHTASAPETLTLIVSLGTDVPTGRFRGVPEPYQVTGTPDALTTALQDLIFDPAPNRLPVGSNEVVSVTITVSDQAGADAPENGLRAFQVQSANDPPQLAVIVNPAAISDEQEVVPFQVTVSDPDLDETFTLTIEPINDTNFVFGVLVPTMPQFSGTETEVENGVLSVRYQPVPDSTAGDQTIQFRFRLTDAHGGEAVQQGQLTIRPVNNPPDIVGTALEVIRLNDDSPGVFPFRTVRVEDVDGGGNQLVTVSLSLSDPSLGVFDPPGPFADLTPAAASAALQAVRFIPQGNRIPVGETRTVTVTITAIDSLGARRDNRRTSLAITSVNGAPRISGVPAPAQQPKLVSPEPPVRPFQGIQVSDDEDTNLTIVVRLDNPAKGALTQLGGFGETSPGSRVYEMSGTPDAINAALTNIEFQVSDTYLFPPTEPGGTTFTLEVSDVLLNTTRATLFIVLQEEPRNYLVTSAEDDGNQPGTLRHALANAENNAVITLALPAYPALIRLDNALGPLRVNRNVTLKGPGAGLFTLSGDSDGDQQPDTQLFFVDAAVTIEGMTLAHGLAGNGGAIGVSTNGHLTLHSCAVTDSQASQWGGAVDVDQGRLTVEQCLFRNNRTDDALGLGGGAVSLYTDKPCRFVNSTFSGNVQASPNGFGGGAIYIENFTPSTVLEVEVTHCTFAENDDAAAAGSSIHANVFGTRVQAQNSVFADGRGRNLDVRGAARIVSAGGNLSDDTTRTILTQGGQPQAVRLLDQASDQVEVDPKLGSLFVPRGAPPAYALEAGSPAIDLTNGIPVAVDQRGVLRDALPDAGAIEAERSARIVINEILTFDDPADYIEFYVPRDAGPVDLSSFTLWVDGERRHVFAGGTVVQPGFGVIVADTLIPLKPTNNPTPVVPPSDAPLNLGSRGVFELRTPAPLELPVLRVAYVAQFVNPLAPTNLTLYVRNAMTLAPQFTGFAFVPHSAVLLPPLGGVDLARDADVNRLSPGNDTAPSPFGAANALPVAVADNVIVHEDQLTSLAVLQNDLDADGTDRLVIVDVSAASEAGVGEAGQATTGQGATVQVYPAEAPLRGGRLIYDPRQASSLQSLPEGRRAEDLIYYEIIDLGTGTIASYAGTPGVSPTRLESAAHRLQDGDMIVISGSGTETYNGSFIVTRVDDDHFTIPVPFAGDAAPRGTWVTSEPRHPSQRQEAMVTIAVLGANDPPTPRDDMVATDEDSPLRVLADPALLRSNPTFPSDSDYPSAPVLSTISLLDNDGNPATTADNDTDPDNDDDASSLQVVGVVGSVHPIADYQGVAGTAPVTVVAPGHGLGDGVQVLVAGYDGHPSYNGFHVVTVLDEDRFSIPVAYVDDAAAKGVWTILTDADRTRTTSADGASVALELRAARQETSVVYNPRESQRLNGLAVGEAALDTFYYAVADRHDGIGLARVDVLVTGVNDTPTAGADPSSLTDLQAQLAPGESLMESLASLQVDFILPPASGSAGRVDVQVRASGEAGPAFGWTDVFGTSEDTVLDLSAGSLLANDTDVDTNDVLSVFAVSDPSTLGAKVSWDGGAGIVRYDPTASVSLNALAREEAVVDSFEVMLTDGAGGVATSVVAVVVIGRNDTPVALPDQAQTLADSVLLVDPIPGLDGVAGDSDADIDGHAPDNRLVLVPAAASPGGLPGTFFEVTSEGVLYDPTGSDLLKGLGPGEKAHDQIAYTVMDGSLVFANDDVFKVAADGTGYRLEVLANDANLAAANGALRIVQIDMPDAEGNVSLSGDGAAVLYTPAVNFVGDQRFVYTVADEAGNVDRALVTVRVIVNQLNGDLQARPDHFSVAKGQSPTLAVLANDNVLPATGESLTITRIVRAPATDTVVLTNNTIVYQQESAGPFPYVETFSYEVSGGGTARAVAEVTVLVVDRQGTLAAEPDVFTVPAGSRDNVLDVLANDSLLPGQTAGLGLQSFTSPAHGQLALNEEGTALLYTPDADFIGRDSFSYAATDGFGGTGTTTVQVDVGRVLTAPDIFAVLVDEMPEDPLVTRLDVLANDRILQQPAGDLQLLDASPAATSLGVMRVAPDGQALEFDPAADQEGEAMFTYIVTDGTGRLAEEHVTVVVLREGVRANADFFAVAQDSGANELPVLANDAALDPGRTLALVSVGAGQDGPNRGGSVSLNADRTAILYTPAVGFAGEESFIYTVSDGRRTDTAKVVVRVSSGALVANDDQYVVFYEEQGTPDPQPRSFALPVTLNDRALPDLGQVLGITVVRADNTGLGQAPAVPGTIRIGPDNVSLVYAPADATGPFPYFERFVYEIADGSTRRAAATVLIEIRARQAIHNADTHDDFFTVARGAQNMVLPVLANDNVKPASAAGWQITSVDAPSQGGVASVSGGAILYTPQPGFTGVETFRYTVSDGRGGTGQATVTVQVGELPLCPDTFAVLSGTVDNRLNVLANDAMRPLTAAGFELVGVTGFDAGGSGTVTDNVVLYTPAPQAVAYPYTEHFDYTVADDSGQLVHGQATVEVHREGSDRASALIAIEVVGVNDPPTIEGTEGDLTVAFGASIRPFAAVTIADVDSFGQQPLSVAVTVAPSNQGWFLDTGPFTQTSPGTYTMAADLPSVGTAALRGLRFVPAPPNGAEPIASRFTIQVDDGFAPPVVDSITTVTTQPVQAHEVLAGDGRSGHLFGTAVAVFEDEVLAGAPGAFESGLNRGAAFLFSPDSPAFEGWSETGKLVPEAFVRMEFGRAVAMRDGLAAVGAPRDAINGLQTGAVYVYAREAETPGGWRLVTRLTPPDGRRADEFGAAVALGTDLLAVGAPAADGPGGLDTGAAYIFKRTPGGVSPWTFEEKRIGPRFGDALGRAVAMVGDVLAAGAPGDDTSGANAGAVHVFQRNRGGPGQWGVVRKIVPPAPAGGSEFGSSLGMDGEWLVIGAPQMSVQGTESGAVFVHRKDQDGPDQWGTVQRLLPGDVAARDHFGAAVAVAGEVVVAGAPQQDSPGQDGGAVYVFRSSNMAADPWGQVAKFVPDTPAFRIGLGSSVAVHGLTVAAGAPQDTTQGSQAGKVHIYRLQSNHAPRVVMTVEDQTARVGEPFEFVLPTNLFADVDPDQTPALSAQADPVAAWLTFDPVSGRFAGIPDGPGSHLITVQATDEEGASGQTSFRLNVLEAGSAVPDVTPGLTPVVRVAAGGSGNELNVSVERYHTDARWRYSLWMSTDLTIWQRVEGPTPISEAVDAVTERLTWPVSVPPATRGVFYRVQVGP